MGNQTAVRERERQWFPGASPQPDDRDHGRPWKGVVAGLVGGFAGTWIMAQFQTLWSAAAERGERSREGRAGEREGDIGSGAGNDGEESPTVKVARMISRRMRGRDLSDDEREPAGTAVSFAFGSAVGAVYGAAAELIPEMRAGAGLPFGAAVWAGADEGMVPALGLSGSPFEAPITAHVFGLASHLVYGLVTDTTRRVVRRLLR